MLDLPNEILIKILRYALISPKPIAPIESISFSAVSKGYRYDQLALGSSKAYNSNAPLRPPSGLSPEILVCCKLLNELGSDLLYKENTIDFSPGFCNTMSPPVLSERIGSEKALLVSFVCYGSQPLSAKANPTNRKLASVYRGHPDDVGVQALRLRDRGIASDQEYQRQILSRKIVGYCEQITCHLEGVRRVCIENNVLAWRWTEHQLKTLPPGDHMTPNALETVTWRCRLTPFEMMLNLKAGTLMTMRDGMWTVEKDIFTKAAKASSQADD